MGRLQLHMFRDVSSSNKIIILYNVHEFTTAQRPEKTLRGIPTRTHINVLDEELFVSHEPFVLIFFIGDLNHIRDCHPKDVVNFGQITN